MNVNYGSSRWPGKSGNTDLNVTISIFLMFCIVNCLQCLSFFVHVVRSL